ncbi:mechanosensitive ion channel family protein [Bacteroides caecigallinarum]|uniref:mechanosensitive ion channel family protein n=1 Tax=Bacteroides caecigallinarum TaxID=1411144 RepID=UPI00195BE952|nr:mechanosensitive ion channel domain-containing protein [Bacteroides caecigallinarum]MBM6881956.1 mechanosensitive ion channel [Bacteroides caecigallinarum]
MNNEVTKEIALLLQNLGVEKNDINWGTQLTILAAIIIITYLCTKLFRHVVIPLIHKITARTKAKWDDYLFNTEMMKAFSRLIPPIMLYVLLPFAFSNSPQLLNFSLKVCLMYMDIVTILLVGTFLNSLYNISNEHEKLRNRPLKGIYQMIKLITIIIGIIILFSIILDQNPTNILAGLGASAAVLMLIFKDSILGLVAGVQLSANDMLRPGDWITMTKYGADGYVIEVSLTTVKVQNFDKTITTIPPYALVSDSFQNWRGMRETGGRRIKRSVNIDMNTIHFCTEGEIQGFIQKGFLDKKTDTSEKIVNLAVFRSYLLNYLNNNPKVNKDLMIMVRQLQPASEGMPLEIYCFSDTPDWIPYETLQSEIFEHVMAMAPEFNLRLFQRPAGTDLQS